LGTLSDHFGDPGIQGVTQQALGGPGVHFYRFLTLRVLPSTLLTFSVQGASVFPLIRVDFGPYKPADRAFGAQRMSGGRTGRRFALPSVAGGASRRHGAPSASHVVYQGGSSLG